MYLLIFEAWATLMGFTLQSGHIYFNLEPISYLVNTNFRQGTYIDEALEWVEGEFPYCYTWSELAMINPNHLIIEDGLEGGYYGISSANQALMLTNIMTHVSMILIFVFFISFIIFLFRLFAHMLSRR